MKSQGNLNKRIVSIIAAITSKYNSRPTQINKSKINDLIYNRHKRFVSLFKEHLINDDPTDFFTSYKPMENSISFYQHFKPQTKFYGINLISREQNKIIFRNKIRKYLLMNFKDKKNTPHASIIISDSVDETKTLKQEFNETIAIGMELNWRNILFNRIEFTNCNESNNSIQLNIKDEMNKEIVKNIYLQRNSIDASCKDNHKDTTKTKRKDETQESKDVDDNEMFSFWICRNYLDMMNKKEPKPQGITVSGITKMVKPKINVQQAQGKKVKILSMLTITNKSDATVLLDKAYKTINNTNANTHNTKQSHQKENSKKINKEILKMINHFNTTSNTSTNNTTTNKRNFSYNHTRQNKSKRKESNQQVTNSTFNIENSFYKSKTQIDKSPISSTSTNFKTISSLSPTGSKKQILSPKTQKLIKPNWKLEIEGEITSEKNHKMSNHQGNVNSIPRPNGGKSSFIFGNEKLKMQIYSKFEQTFNSYRKCSVSKRMIFNSSARGARQLKKGLFQIENSNNTSCNYIKTNANNNNNNTHTNKYNNAQSKQLDYLFPIRKGYLTEKQGVHNKAWSFSTRENSSTKKQGTKNKRNAIKPIVPYWH